MYGWTEDSGGGGGEGGRGVITAIVSSGNGLPLSPADKGPECDRRGEFSRGDVEIKSRWRAERLRSI